VAELINVAVGAEAADDRGAERGVNGVTLDADGDLAIVAHTDAGLLAPGITQIFHNLIEGNGGRQKV